MILIQIMTKLKEVKRWLNLSRRKVDLYSLKKHSWKGGVQKDKTNWLQERTLACISTGVLTHIVSCLRICWPRKSLRSLLES